MISDRLGAWDILEPFVTATKIINVPVAKSHNLMGSAAGMKNWIGITTKLRYLFHNDIDASIAELARLMKPTLTVIDATRVLMHGGPAGGSLAAVNPYGAVAAGFDPVALDAWAASIFPSSDGSTPEYLRIAERMGLGSSDFRSFRRPRSSQEMTEPDRSESDSEGNRLKRICAVHFSTANLHQ